MRKIYLLLLVVLAVSCKKDDPGLSVADLLTRPAGGWIRTSIIVEIPGTALDVDIVTRPDLYKDCDKDDATVFLADGTYRVESTVKCDAGESQVLALGTWSLSADEKTIVITIAGVPALGDIYELDEDHFKAKLDITVDGVKRSGVITMKPKS